MAEKFKEKLDKKLLNTSWINRVSDMNDRQKVLLAIAIFSWLMLFGWAMPSENEFGLTFFWLSSVLSSVALYISSIKK